MLRPIVVALLLLALAACQHRVAAPANVTAPVTVYIVDYGRHAGLALPSGDGRLTEWFWGDWNYFALERRSFWDGIQALFFSRGATLGRLDLKSGSAREIRAATNAESVLSVVVDQGRAAALHAALDARYDRRRDSEIVQADGRRFVHDDARYTLFYNSTHMTRDWLEALDCAVRGSALSANFAVLPQFVP